MHTQHICVLLLYYKLTYCHICVMSYPCPVLTYIFYPKKKNVPY